jgi:hypothetical protein
MQKRTLFAAFALLLPAFGCDAHVWRSFSRTNPDNCAVSGEACPAGFGCNSVTQVCEPLPDVQSVEPALASGSGGATVTVRGQGFHDGTQVFFGQPPGALGTGIAVLGDTEIRLTLPPNPDARWAVPVTVGAPGLVKTRSGLFSYYAEDISFSRQDLSFLENSDAIALGDINKDGLADIVTVNSSLAIASIVVGRGDGTFGKGSVQSGLEKTISFVKLADINKDGYPDVLAASAKGIYTFLNNRQGGIDVGQQVSTDGAVPFGDVLMLTAADFNQDGALDLAVANGAAGTVTLLSNDGRGGFGAPVTPESLSKPSAVLAADLDLDGAVDLITLSQNKPVQVYLGDGKGGFAASSTAGAAGCGPRDGALVDLNSDGLPELVVSCFMDSSVRVLPGTAPGRFASGDAPVATLMATATLATADVNGDRHPDVLLALTSTPSPYVMRGDGKGGLVAPVKQNNQPGTAGVPRIVVGDVNLDGKPDLLLSTSPPSVYLNTSR